MEADSNQKLSSKLAAGGARMTPSAFREHLIEWWKGNASDMRRLIGSEEDAKRLFSTAIFVLNKNPTLIECEPLTFFQCLMRSAALKLYPGPMNECAYVPFRNNKMGGRKEATFITMYPGMVKLAYNSGFVKRVDAKIVYEADEFQYEDGLNPVLKFKPFMGPESERGQRVLVYAFAITRYDEIQVACLSPWMVEQHRNRSRAKDSSDSPWNSKFGEDVDWMWKKTALLQALKLIPKSPDMADAIDIEQQEKPKEVINLGDILSATKKQSKEAAQQALPAESTGVQVDMTAKEKEPVELHQS